MKILILSLFYLAITTFSLCFQSTYAEPMVIGQGEYLLKPDKKIFYKKAPIKDGEIELHLHLFLPKGYKETDQRAAVVFYHGGGWHAGDPGHFYPQARYLALRGMVAISAEYRLIKRDKTTPRECVADGKSAFRWVKQNAAKLGINPNKIVAGGGSAGAHIAAAVAQCKGFETEGEDLSIDILPKALLLYNPVYDNGPGGFAHGLVKDYWQQISPMHNITKTVPPTIVLLGSKDDLIPVATAEKYKKLVEEQGGRCDLHIYKDKVHGFFNIWNGHEDLKSTMLKVDQFLISLGILEGEPLPFLKK